jgi:hypothetical protein
LPKASLIENPHKGMETLYLSDNLGLPSLSGLASQVKGCYPRKGLNPRRGWKPFEINVN